MREKARVSQKWTTDTLYYYCRGKRERKTTFFSFLNKLILTLFSLRMVVFVVGGRNGVIFLHG